MNPSDPTGGSLAHDTEALALWNKLKDFSFDSGDGPQTFAARLAAEQNWPPVFAARAIEEYRRFLLLFVLRERQQRDVQTAAPHDAEASPTVQIVPSAVVDKVWHLHLLYTRSYWETLCRDILGSPLHHLPANGSGGEAMSLDNVYLLTLAAYQHVFGKPAPPEIWPRSQAELRKPTVREIRQASAQALAAVAPGNPAGKEVGMVMTVLGAAAFFAIGHLFPGNGVAFEIFAVCMVIAGIIVANLVKNTDGARGRGRRSAAWSFDGDGYSGWAGTSGDGTDNAGGHHDSGHHGGSHDAGGGHSSHSCGGHSCGGGHGCGGGGCGGGH